MPAVPAGGNAQLLPCVAMPASVIQFSRCAGFPYLPRNRGNACSLKGYFTSLQRHIILKGSETAVRKNPTVFTEKSDRLPRLLYVFNLVKSNFAVTGFQGGNKCHSRCRAVIEHATRIFEHVPKILFHDISILFQSIHRSGAVVPCGIYTITPFNGDCNTQIIKKCGISQEI